MYGYLDIGGFSLFGGEPFVGVVGSFFGGGGVEDGPRLGLWLCGRRGGSRGR